MNKAVQAPVRDRDGAVQADGNGQALPATGDSRVRAAAAIAESVKEALAVLDAGTKRALAILAELSSQSETTAPAPDEPDWITMGAAGNIRKVSIETITKYVIERGLGVKTAGRWRVDRKRLMAWMAGSPYQPLEPFPDDDVR